MKIIKRMSLIGIAALAITALAGVASASASEFKAEAFPVTIKGSGKQTIATNAGVVSCATTQNGAASSSATWWTVKVTDSSCTMAGVAVNVDWGDCEILYYTYSGFYVVCKGGAVKATVVATNCVVEIGPQEVETVAFTNLGSGTTRTINANVKVSGVKYTQNSNCAGGAGTFTNGTIGGEVLLKGFTSKGVQQGIFIE